MNKLYCIELIRKLQLIRQNRCSLSDDDKEVIDEVISLLESIIAEDDDKPDFGKELFVQAIILIIKYLMDY